MDDMDGCTGCSLKHESILVQSSQMEDIISGLKTYKKHGAKSNITNPMRYFKVYLGWRVEQLETG